MNAGSHSAAHSAHRRGKSWKDYLPLIVLLVITALAAGSKAWSYGPSATFTLWMHDFMGLFLVIFAMLKLFDLPGFADGFHRYDLLAQRTRSYGFVYPFIELALGVGYLSGHFFNFIYPATVIVMTFGAIGVIVALIKGLDIHCACMGTTLKVPLSTVALVEDMGMTTMAVFMWIGHHG